MWLQAPSRDGFRRRAPGLILTLAVLSAAGCGGPTPRPPETAEALATLRAVLEAWQQGERPEALQRRQPPIQAVDPDWSQGVRLSRFEIEADQARPSGYDLGCRVKLWLGDGKREPRRVKYTVATAPARVVTRDYGG